jgi:hypothetical protein
MPAAYPNAAGYVRRCLTPLMSTTSPELSRRQWLGSVAGPTLAASILASSQLSAAEPAAADGRAAVNRGAGIFNVRDFGAKGDGHTLDTAAIQAAVDACHADTGGVVLVPAGVFVISNVELKSNVTLHLAPQAKLLGTTDGKQYHGAKTIPLQDGPGQHTMGDGNVALIWAANAENIAIEGQGTIDGQGAAFHAAVRGERPPAGIGGRDRPHHIILYRCRNAIVRDVFLTASAFQSIRICVCTDVKIDGVRIHSRVNSNNDGLHFIASEHCHVSNCTIHCQDDACALFGSCKFITITNCFFSTRWSVFRFGSGQAENITVSNCLITGTWGCPIKLRCDARSRFENISFSNLVLKDITGPISIGLGPQHPGTDSAKPGIVRNISFNGIHAVVAKPRALPETDIGSRFSPGEMFSCIILNGMDEGFLENISFNDVHVTFPGGGTAEQGAVREVPKIAAEYYAIGVSPAHGLFARNVRGLTLNNVRFDLAAPDERPALILDHVQDAAINAFSATGNPKSESVIRTIDARAVLISAARVITSAPVFLQAEGAATERIIIDGGDLTLAEKPVKLAAGAKESAVRLRA